MEELVTTPFLAQYGVAFNTLYKILICTSCAEGFSLQGLHTHFNTDGAIRPNWDKQLEHWSASKVVFEDHPCTATGKPDTFQNLVVESLISGGLVTNPEEICDAADFNSWKEIGLPKFTGDRPQVLGLRTFAGAFRCIAPGVKGKTCGYISTALSTIKNHCTQHHPGLGFKRGEVVLAQTLCEVPGQQIYFEVSLKGRLSTYNQTTNSNTISINASGFDLEAARGLLHQTTATYTNNLIHLNVAPDLNMKTILPVFVETGVDQFIQPFNRKNFRKRYDPSREDPMYLTLRGLVLETYRQDMDNVKEGKLPANLLFNMTNCTP